MITNPFKDKDSQNQAFNNQRFNKVMDKYGYDELKENDYS